MHTGQPILSHLGDSKHGAAYRGSLPPIVIIATGQQRLTMVSPLAEGICNLASSLVLGSMLGAIGVALGTLIGGCVGIAAQLFYSMPRTNALIWCPRRRVRGLRNLGSPSFSRSAAHDNSSAVAIRHSAVCVPYRCVRSGLWSVCSGQRASVQTLAIIATDNNAVV